MKTSLRRLSLFIDSPFAAPLLLALVTVLAYGLLISQLGFYWDELPMSWIRYELGPDAMARYFSTNRPVWGMLYQLTTRILPQVPIYWQIFGLFWRWMSALLVWAIMRDLWPGRRQLALIVSLFFLLYPGFNQQWTAYLYSHFFIVLSFFLFSILCMLWSFRFPRWHWPLTIFALAFSALNLWMLEYFFTLELFRPFVIFYFVFSFEDLKSFGPRLRRTILLWIPYLLVFLADIYWRLFVFNNTVYQPALIPKLKAAPLATLAGLARTIFSNLYTVSLTAWGQVFQFPNPVVNGPRTTFYYAVVILLTGLLAAFFLSANRPVEDDKPRSAFWPLALGLIAMLTAGGPFWLAGLDITLAYPASRFTLPFMLGVSLLLAGLLGFIPVRARLAIASVLILLAAGRQALWADDFRRDWNTQKTIFWQMFWRAPGIAPNTIVLLNDGAFQFYADNSLAAALNWIYDPGNRSNAMDYVLFFPTSRLGGSLQGFEAGQPVTYDFISEIFRGNTSQVIAFYYQPPGCLRLLDPEIESQNRFIPDATRMREAAALSSSAWITPDETARMPKVYGPEPARGWCYYFEQADLARQMGDWQRVVELGDKAFNLNDYPNDPIERFVFIEGYAHAGNWTRAKELAIASYKVSPNYVGPLLCRLLNRIDRGIPASAEKQTSLNDLRARFSCLP
ncbi:MAG: hypothetical protein HYX49_13535 [Chloroflexi bacterium]|nr:hypothetical protein [Chloroflexota bacterium]